MSAGPALLVRVEQVIGDRKAEDDQRESQHGGRRAVGQQPHNRKRNRATAEEAKRLTLVQTWNSWPHDRTSNPMVIARCDGILLQSSMHRGGRHHDFIVARVMRSASLRRSPATVTELFMWLIVAAVVDAPHACERRAG